MKSKSLITAAAFAAFVFATGPATHAANNTFQPDGDGVNGAWNDSNDWSGGIPDATDNVIVPSGKICALDTTAGLADSLEIAGTLNVTGVSLTVDGTSDSDHSITGSVFLKDGSASLVFTSTNHTMSGSNGKIDGEHNSAQIEDDNNPRTLTINTGFSIVGALQLKLPVAVSGGAKIDADDGNTNRTTITFSVAPTGAGDFKATASSAVMKFGVASTSMSGNFYVSGGGILDVDENVSTTGDLKSFTGTGSKIDVAGGKSIAFGQ